MRTRIYTIECDECGDDAISWSSARTAIREAIENGWKLGKRDLCPGCQDEHRCPHDGRRLEWASDQWYCPRCGDEWSDETEVSA